MARQHISTLKTNMVKENTSLKIRQKKLDEVKNYLLQDIKHDLMSKKQKRMCRTLNYFEHSLLFISAVTDCVLIFAFVSLVRIPIGISSSAVLLKICALTAEIKKYKPII